MGGIGFSNPVSYFLLDRKVRFRYDTFIILKTCIRMLYPDKVEAETASVALSAKTIKFIK